MANEAIFPLPLLVGMSPMSQSVRFRLDGILCIAVENVAADGIDAVAVQRTSADVFAHRMQTVASSSTD